MHVICFACIFYLKKEMTRIPIAIGRLELHELEYIHKFEYPVALDEFELGNENLIPNS